MLNGIWPDGSYAYPRPDDSEVARWLLPPEPPPKSRLRAPAPGVKPEDLASAGWGVVYPLGERARFERLLADLLDLREKQAGDLYQPIEVYPNETCDYFLQRHRANTGMADPHRLPYYLLLVGGPEQISFQFQGQLDQVFAVGRLHFDREEQYAAYAASVKDVETEPPWRPSRRVTLFGVQNEGDRATRRTTERLVEPLSEELEGRLRRRPGWQMERIVGPAAQRDALRTLLTSRSAPDLLFTAGHGMVFGPDVPQQAALQGALLCSDWPGPGNPVEREHYLAAEDLLIEGRPLLGTVTIHLACHSGGTPKWDTFHPPGAEHRRQLTQKPFVAALPQRLLGDAGALAVIAHVDRAWTTSFDWEPMEEEPDPGVFLNTIMPLVDGCRVGNATEALGALYSLLAAQTKERCDDRRNRGLRTDEERTARFWRATNDIRSFVTYGDPAIRLGIASS